MMVILRLGTEVYVLVNLLFKPIKLSMEEKIKNFNAQNFMRHYQRFKKKI